MSIFDLQFLEISQVGSSYLNDSGLFQNREVRDGDTLVATHGLKVNKVSRRIASNTSSVFECQRSCNRTAYYFLL